jgi:hypothetical protein
MNAELTQRLPAVRAQALFRVHVQLGKLRAHPPSLHRYHNGGQVERQATLTEVRELQRSGGQQRGMCGRFKRLVFSLPSPPVHGTGLRIQRFAATLGPNRVIGPSVRIVESPVRQACIRAREQTSQPRNIHEGIPRIPRIPILSNTYSELGRYRKKPT